ncbi:LytR family transcriptional regulator [Candidatus Uhrbacteria bacterium UHB]|nr:LytR family transcriptional regulator [Candidatus Uhrbacteria bacterium UHB]RIL00770.1 MAG: hypothetical protein DCC77_04530 [Candidatus Uhrbacteria bacterium]
MPVKRVSAKAPVQAPRTPFFTQPLILLILVVAMAAAALYLLLTQPNKAAPQRQAVPVAKTEDMQQEVESIVTKVSRHLLVNPNEAPYVATITNIDLVRQNNPVFYKDAEQGDKVLIWSDKAVVYSPTKDKLVAVMTSIPPDLSQQPTSTPSEPEKQANIEIRNGSRVAGAASRLRTTLRESGMTVISIGDAGAVYEETLIIDLTGGAVANAITALAEAIPEAQATSVLPDTERATTADILILIGRDVSL